MQISGMDITEINQSTRNPTTFTPTGTNYKEPGGTSSFIKKMDDAGRSNYVLNREYTSDDLRNPQTTLRGAYHAANLFMHDEIDLFRKYYRFGLVNPYDSIGTVKEYLFFTKPDLNIYPRDDDNGIPSRNLDSYLQTDAFWLEMADRYLPVIKCLQSSISEDDGPFNNLLANMVQSTLEVPPLQATMIETPNNMFGVGYTYRGSSEASNDTYNFSLEFRDTKWKHVYNFFAMYEDYETLKHHGVLQVYDYYRWAKILYDQYAIYKIMVDSDGETILYAGKAYGVKSKSLPRDAFSNADFSNGLSYSIEFEAAFYDDKPRVLYEFNNLARSYYERLPYQIDIHNHILDRPDNRPAQCAYIVGLPGDKCAVYHDPKDTKGPTTLSAPGQRVLKLKWRGSDIE